MRNLILGIINYISLPLINILLLRKITACIEPNIYGNYIFYNNIVSIILTFSFLEILPVIIQRYLNKNFSNYKEIEKIIIYINYLSIASYVLTTFFMFIIMRSSLFLLVALNLIFNNLSNQLIGYYIINGEVKKRNLIKMINIMVYGVSLVILIQFKFFNIYTIFIGNLLYNLILLLYIGSKNLKKILLKEKIDFELLKKILKYGVPFVFISLSGIILSIGDRYMIKFLLNNGEYWIGIYSIQYGLYSQIFNLVSQLYYLYIPSKLYVIFEENGLDNFLEKLRIWIKSYIILGVLIIILVEVSYPKISNILLAQNYNLDVNFIIYIVLGGFLFGLYRLFGEVLNMLKLTNYLNISIWISGALNLILNFFFIPKLGIKGAAITTFISYFILLVIIYSIILIKLQKKILSYKEVTLLFFFILSVIFIDENWVRGVLQEDKLKIIISGIVEVGIITIIYLIIFKRSIFQVLEKIK